MKKKLTRNSFSALRETATLLDEREQRAVIGGDYWDDYGVWATDSSGNMYWTRTSDGDGGSGYYDGNSYPSLTDGVDYGNSGHFTFNTSGNTAFQNQLTSILGSNSVIRQLLGYFNSGIVHMTFDVNNIGGIAHTNFASSESYHIVFDNTCINENGWNNILSGDNIGYDWSKVHNNEEALVVILAHEAMHANHYARYQDALKSTNGYPDQAVNKLINSGYSMDFVQIFFKTNINGDWTYNYDGNVEQRMHDYMAEYNKGLIDGALEEYRRDHEN